MKKIVTLGAIAVLSAGFMFADEPAADLSITEFKGDAKVTWGMDLDAGKTGFKNTESANFKVKLFNGGNKTTSGEDDVWAELKIKTDGLKLENGEWKDGKASVDAAKIHIGDFFVGIRAGDTVVGEYKFDGAIRSPDKDASKWIENVGPNWNDYYKFKYGIEAGLDNNNLKVVVDFRSAANAKDDKDTQYTNSYAVSLDAGLKDSNEFLPGLFVNGGIAYNFSHELYHKGAVDNGKEDDLKDGKKQYYFDETTGKPAVKQKDKAGITDSPVTRQQLWIEKGQNGHIFGYAANLGYKYAIDDKYFVKPVLAFAGSFATEERNLAAVGKDEEWYKFSRSENDLAFGLMFGWGATADDNAGVPYLDGDMAKKVTPGISVVVGIPFTTSEKGYFKAGNTVKAATSKKHSSIAAVIVPSFYTKGDLVEGLTAGLYSEIAVLNYKDNPDTKDANRHDASYTKTNDDGTSSETWNNCAWKDEKLAFAIAAGLKYEIKAEDITVTPKVGFRFANVAYKENGIEKISPLSSEPVFANMGTQDTIWDNNNAKKKYGNGGYQAGFFNLKGGVDFGGLINNTTFSIEYESANLLNKTDYKSEKYVRNGKEMANPLYNLAFNQKWYNVKLGHLDVGCKIAF